MDLYRRLIFMFAILSAPVGSSYSHGYIQEVKGKLYVIFSLYGWAFSGPQHSNSNNPSQQY